MGALIYWSIAVVAGQLVGLVFLFAGVGKVLTGSAAGDFVEHYGLLPRPVAHSLGRLLPWVELTIAASLLTGLVSRWAAVFAFTLLVAFSLAQTIVLLRGQEVPCGCFGTLSSRPVRWRTVFSNLVLSASCLLATRVCTSLNHSESFVSRLSLEEASSSSTADVALLKLLVTGSFIQFLGFKQLLENRAHDQAYLRYLRDLSAAAAIQAITPRPNH